MPKLLYAGYIIAKIVVNLILVILTWRVFIGVLIIPIVVAIVSVQVCIRGCQRLCRRCCPPSDALTETQEVTQDMSLFCVSSEEHLLGANTQLADDETIVEVVIYELWPSSMPCYIGTWLGACRQGP